MIAGKIHFAHGGATKVLHSGGALTEGSNLCHAVSKSLLLPQCKKNIQA